MTRVTAKICSPVRASGRLAGGAALGAAGLTAFISPKGDVLTARTIDSAPTSGPDDAAAEAARIASGDREALARFYNAWFPRALSMARSLTGRDESFCLDMVQDAFLRIVRSPASLRSIRDGAHLERWVVRVTHSAALDALRSEGRRVLRDRTRATSATEPARDSARELAERIEHIAGRLHSLQPEERGMLRLRFGSGLSLKQTGEASGVTPFAAHGKLRRLLERLRREEEDHL